LLRPCCHQEWHSDDRAALQLPKTAFDGRNATRGGSLTIEGACKAESPTADGRNASLVAIYEIDRLVRDSAGPKSTQSRE